MKKQTLIISLLSLVLLSLILETTAGQEISKKWYPGHYVKIRHLDGPLLEGPRNLVKNNPYIKGYKIHVVWNELELAKDVYDWTVIQEYINLAESDGKKLMIHIQDRLFGTKANPYMPSYMLAAEYEGGWFYSSSSGASYPKVWLASFQGRWNKLIQAMGEALDNNETISGIIVSETSLNTEDAVGYSKTGHMNFIKSMHSAASESMPKTIFFQYVNWGFTVEERLEMMTHIVEVCKNSFGGPDIINCQPKWDSYRYVLKNAFKDYYAKYRGIAALSIEQQGSGYYGLDARTYFDYAVDEVQLHFLPWTVYNKTDRAWTFNDALNIINQEKGRINTTPPSQYLISSSGNNTGISDNIFVFPNPATDFVKLKTEGRRFVSSYALFDLTGKLMESNVVNSMETIIPLTHIAPGTYILKMYLSSKETEIIKLIKRIGC
jgi:hypothetical protein